MATLDERGQGILNDGDKKEGRKGYQCDQNHNLIERWFHCGFYKNIISSTAHIGIIFQLGYDSGHIGNPFYPLFYYHLSEYPAPFHIMWPRMNNQKILYPLCAHRNSRYDFKPLRSLSGADLMGGKRIFEAIGGGGSV